MEREQSDCVESLLERIARERRDGGRGRERSTGGTTEPAAEVFRARVRGRLASRRIANAPLDRGTRWYRLFFIHSGGTRHPRTSRLISFHCAPRNLCAPARRQAEELDRQDGPGIRPRRPHQLHGSGDLPVPERREMLPAHTILGQRRADGLSCLVFLPVVRRQVAGAAVAVTAARRAGVRRCDMFLRLLRRLRLAVLPFAAEVGKCSIVGIARAACTGTGASTWRTRGPWIVRGCSAAPRQLRSTSTDWRWLQYSAIAVPPTSVYCGPILPRSSQVRRILGSSRPVCIGCRPLFTAFRPTPPDLHRAGRSNARPSLPR